MAMFSLTNKSSVKSGIASVNELLNFKLLALDKTPCVIEWANLNSVHDGKQAHSAPMVPERKKSSIFVAYLVAWNQPDNSGSQQDFLLSECEISWEYF